MRNPKMRTIKVKFVKEFVGGPFASSTNGYLIFETVRAAQIWIDGVEDKIHVVYGTNDKYKYTNFRIVYAD